MFLKDRIPESETTDGMVLAYNKTNNPQTITVNGHMLGAGQTAWVTQDDPVLIRGIENQTFRLLNTSTPQKQQMTWVPQPQPQTPPSPQQSTQNRQTSASSNKKKKPRR